MSSDGGLSAGGGGGLTLCAAWQNLIDRADRRFPSPCSDAERGRCPVAGERRGAKRGAPHRDSDFGAQAAGLLLALSHWRACQQQALRDPRSILVGEW